MNRDAVNVILVGVGGQGIILASTILAEAALEAGYDVRRSEIHGMAQRGGSVSSHVRFGANVKSPVIERGSADYMLSFEKAESLRWCDFMKKGAEIILNDTEIVPTTVSMGVSTYPENVVGHLEGLGFGVFAVDAQKIGEEAGNPKTANVALLAVLASFLKIDREIWGNVVRSHVPAKFLDINMKAFGLGLAEGDKYLSKLKKGGESL